MKRLTILFILLLGTISALAQTKVSLPVWLSSHSEWRKYQLDPYATWSSEGLTDNNNCGPASVAMAFYYFLGIDLSTTYGSSPTSAQTNSL